MKGFILHALVEIYIKKITFSHDTIEFIKPKTPVKTDSSTQSFKFYKVHCSLKITFIKNYYDR